MLSIECQLELNEVSMKIGQQLHLIVSCPPTLAQSLPLFTVKYLIVAKIAVDIWKLNLFASLSLFSKMI